MILHHRTGTHAALCKPLYPLKKLFPRNAAVPLKRLDSRVIGGPTMNPNNQRLARMEYQTRQREMALSYVERARPKARGSGSLVPQAIDRERFRTMQPTVFFGRVLNRRTVYSRVKEIFGGHVRFCDFDTEEQVRARRQYDDSGLAALCCHQQACPARTRGRAGFESRHLIYSTPSNDAATAKRSCRSAHENPVWGGNNSTGG